MEIREAAILLFGDLCKIKEDASDDEPTPTTEALKEQIFSNFFLLLLHLSENNIQIDRVILNKIAISIFKINLME